MDRIARALMICLLLASGVGCHGSQEASPGEAHAVEVAAVAPDRRAGACPPGTVFDGTRCRQQRGIIIDQRQPAPEPRPAPPDMPAPPPPAPPAPLPGPGPLPPS